MSNSTKATIAVISAFVAMCLMAAGYLAFRQPLAVGLGDCLSLKTIAAEDEREVQRHVPGSVARRWAEQVFQDSLDAYTRCISSGAPTPDPTTSVPPESPEPSAAPTPPAPTPDAYACRPMSVFDLPGKSGPRSLAPRQASELATAVATERLWAWCDSAVLVEYAIHYKVNGLEELTFPQDQDLAIHLRDQALQGDHDEWNALYGELVAQLDASRRSLGATKAGATYWSRQGQGHTSGVVAISDVKMYRNQAWATLDTILPDGTKVQKRLECDQFQILAENKKPGASRSPVLREEIRRDEEATPITPKPKPSSGPEEPTAEPTPSVPPESPEPSATPTPPPPTTPPTTPPESPSPSPSPSEKPKDKDRGPRLPSADTTQTGVTDNRESTAPAPQTDAAQPITRPGAAIPSGAPAPGATVNPPSGGGAPDTVDPAPGTGASGDQDPD